MPLRRLPPLGSLRAFEAAARHLSFKEAAVELSVTPGAISQQIRALEEDLEVKLFARAVRSVSLTDEGRQLQPALAEAFRQIRAAIDSVRPEPDAPLRVESSGPIITKWLLPRLQRFSERYPELSVEFGSVSLLSPLTADGPDVILRFTSAPMAGVFSLKLCDEFVVPLASPRLVSRLDLRTPTDMARAPLLHDASLEVFGDPIDWSHWFTKVGIDPAGARRGVRFDRHAADQALEAAANGAGVVLGRRLLARADMLDGRLVSPFGPAIKAPASYFVVCRKGDERRPKIAAFINWMREETFAIADGAAEPIAQAC